MKRLRLAVGLIVTAVIVFLIVGILGPSFSSEEASLALGSAYSLSADWTVEYPDGSSGSGIKLPLEIPADNASKVVLKHAVSNDYEGLALTFYAENAALRVFIEGKPVYEAGVSGVKMGPMPEGAINGAGESSEQVGEIENSEENTNNEESETSEDAGDTENGDETTSSEETEEEVTKTEAGEIVADLPSTLTDGTMAIELTQVDDSKGIFIHESYVAKRDVQIIAVFRDSILPIVCCVLILLMSVVVVTLDVMRAVSGNRMRGLGIVALMGVDAIIFIAMQTGLLKMFFGNRDFFEKILYLCIVIMPVLLMLFYYKGFHQHFPELTSGLVLLVTVGTISILLIEFKGTSGISMIFLWIIYAIVFAGILFILYRWRKISTGYQMVAMDFAGVICFVIAVILALEGENARHTNFRDCVVDIFILVAFFFIMLQHIHIVISEYKGNVEKTAKELEKQVEIAEEARAEAISANEAKGVFLANMSHEIRTPINAVLGMDEMILRESGEKQIRDYAMDIHTAGQSLLAIINDILDLSKIESGKMEIVPVDYDLSSVIHDLSNMIMLRARNKDLKFEVSVDRNLPSRMFGDDVRIKQVITNILTNAVKYTEEGCVWMRISGKKDGEYEILHVEVEDTGIGIKKEDMGKLFEAFQRIEEGRNRNIEGTGLGMNITMQMLDLMGSKLQVESEYGKGSKFYFDLRQKIMSEVPIGDFEERIKTMGDEFTYKESFIAPDAHLLVVDDNSMNRKVFSSLLKPMKVKVTEADGGQKAIDLASSQHFDIIFMDHMMPEIDGVEALHRIRSLEDYPCKDTPIYVLTANAVAGAKEQYLEEGFDGFLSKPIVSEKLEEVIKQNLPEEMILPAPKEEVKKSADSSFIDDLPIVDGLDWQVAFLHLPEEELMKSAFSEFYSLIKLHGDKLQKMKDSLPEELDAYRIQVHGMKSSAASVGIIPLAGMAKILEFAAKDGDISRIEALHDVFMSEWMSYCEKLQGVMGLGIDDDGEKENIDSNALSVLLNVIKQAMEDMDIDGADDGIQKLTGLNLPENMREDAENLKGMVADLDSDGAGEIVDRMLHCLD